MFQICIIWHGAYPSPGDPTLQKGAFLSYYLTSGISFPVCVCLFVLLFLLLLLLFKSSLKMHRTANIEKRALPENIKVIRGRMK